MPGQHAACAVSTFPPRSARSQKATRHLRLGTYPKIHHQFGTALPGRLVAGGDLRGSGRVAGWRRGCGLWPHWRSVSGHWQRPGEGPLPICPLSLLQLSSPIYLQAVRSACSGPPSAGVLPGSAQSRASPPDAQGAWQRGSRGVLGKSGGAGEATASSLTDLTDGDGGHTERGRGGQRLKAWRAGVGRDRGETPETAAPSPGDSREEEAWQSGGEVAPQGLALCQAKVKCLVCQARGAVACWGAVGARGEGCQGGRSLSHICPASALCRLPSPLPLWCWGAAGDCCPVGSQPVPGQAGGHSTCQPECQTCPGCHHLEGTTGNHSF